MVYKEKTILELPITKKKKNHNRANIVTSRNSHLGLSMDSKYVKTSKGDYKLSHQSEGFDSNAYFTGDTCAGQA